MQIVNSFFLTLDLADLLPGKFRNFLHGELKRWTRGVHIIGSLQPIMVYMQFVPHFMYQLHKF